MMVSVPRSSVRESDSDSDCEGDDDYEEHREDETESEGSSDSDEEARRDTPEEESEDADDASEVEAEKEDVEMTDQNDAMSGSLETREQVKSPPPNMTDAQVVRTGELPVPTLHRQDAQNPILGMNPKQASTSSRTLSKSATRGRSSTHQQHQMPPPYELLLGSIDSMVMVKPQEKETSESFHRRSTEERDNDDDDSWRPREPVTSSAYMEVENDEIVDSSSPLRNLPSRTSKSSVFQGSSRRLPRMASQALQLVAARPPSPPRQDLINEETQGSVELGDSQRFVRDPPPTTMQETQFSKPAQESNEDVEEAEEEEKTGVSSSQMSYVPESSYFARASQSLQKPARKPFIVRTKSMPASMHTPRAPEKMLVTGGVTMTEAFQHTIPSSQSRSKSSGVRGTLITATPGSEKSLRTLTRQASRGLGTLSSSNRKRLVSLSFVPPFKK
jgi:hypothetical protein